LGDFDEESEKIFTVFNCGHRFCLMCLDSYLSNKIFYGHAFRFLCPYQGCHIEIQNYEILKILKTGKDIERYYEETINQYITEISYDCRSCPSCSTSVIFDEDSYSSSIRCPKCKILYCAGCSDYWHSGLSCYEAKYEQRQDPEDPDEELNVIWKSKYSKPCPSCRVDIEKSEGCNHMTCTQCEYTFCWICLSECEDGHFQRGECDGRQFEITVYSEDEG
jgi:hypothetical protein